RKYKVENQMNNKFQQSPRGSHRGGSRRPSTTSRGGSIRAGSHSRGRGSQNHGSHSTAPDAALHGTRGGGVVSRARGLLSYRNAQQQQRFSSAASSYWQQQQQQYQQVSQSSASSMMTMPPPSAPPPQRPWQQQQQQQQLRGRGSPSRQKRYAGRRRGSASNAASSSQQQQHQHQSSSTAPTSTTSTSAAVVDPLNLRWVAAESERRARGGHSPLPGDSPEPEPPSANQQQKFVAIYGNFRADYNRQTRGASEFNIGQMQDDRLQLLQQDWYTGRDVLDIGCNDGVFSMRIAEAMGIKSLTGLDIDEELVRTAQSYLEDRLRELEKEEEGKSPDRGGFPYNITFKAGNYVLENESDLARVEENKYDVIQAFSITKWIHLNWGDRGLKLFFKRAYRELRPDGKFIVEPQPYKSYQRTLLCPTHKQKYASNIELKPEQFKQYLEREVGFAHIVSVWEQQQCHGFQQPLLLCSKPSGRTPALARETSQHNFRLFVPSHPLRAQLNPSPYQTDSIDQFYIGNGNGGPEDMLLYDNEDDAAPDNEAGGVKSDDATAKSATVDDEAKDDGDAE
ncbi:hypothetical protein BOX15_Mlig005655g2, partial [Macrostomum lignano]